MKIPLVDLRAQHQRLRAEIESAMAEVVRDGDFILGNAVGRFEEAFARFVGTRHCVGVASGTDALALAVRQLGIGPGDKVLLPANTFIATAVAVNQAGATPVLCDVDQASHTIDVAAARKALPAGTRAIIPVHLYGQPADMEGVLDLAQEKGLLVVEDAAQAHGAVHARGRCGTFGRAAAFSFYPGKNLGAYGDAGAVCTDDDDLAQRLRVVSNVGATEKYVHPVIGCNSRLDTLQAAVLLAKLPHLEEGNRQRRVVADWYREALADLADEVELPAEAVWTRMHVYHLFVVRLRRAPRDAVARALRECGIGAGIHYPVPIHRQRAYAHLGLGPGSLPVTERAALTVLSLPMYPELTREQVGMVAGALHKAITITRGDVQCGRC